MEKRIASLRDLEVHQNTYKACIEVMKWIIPLIPDIVTVKPYTLFFFSGGHGTLTRSRYL
jgi:hypothetical protein